MNVDLDVNIMDGNDRGTMEVTTVTFQGGMQIMSTVQRMLITIGAFTPTEKKGDLKI